MLVLNVLFRFRRPVSFCVFINSLVDGPPIQVTEELWMVETEMDWGDQPTRQAVRLMMENRKG
jgi:hypothetical protein